MVKKLFSLVAAAALVGGIAVATTPATSQAGTVTVKGDTEAQLYGFVWAEYSWNKQVTGDPDHSNMPLPDATKEDSKLYQDTYNKIKFSTNTYKTRIGLSFKNPTAGIKGRIEADFAHGSNFRLRRAYIQHNFENLYLLVGQEWILEHQRVSISTCDKTPAGMHENIHRVPQIRIGTKLDLGSATLDLAMAFEAGFKSAVSSSNEPNALVVDRAVIPYPAARAILTFDTGFGAPARIYAWGSVIPVYISDKNGGSIVSDNSETSFAFGAGIKLPISIFTIGANYQYSDGATNYAGLTNYQPASYYYNSKGDVKDTKMQALNINLVVSPMPRVSIGVEYDYVEFKNNDIWNDKPEVATYLGNIKIKTTSFTTLSLEWRHIKARHFNEVGVSDDDMSGDQIFALYKYNF